MDPITKFIFAAGGGSKGPFDLNFLVIAGGGGGGNGAPSGAAQNGGGGAGGYICSWDPSRTGGNQEGSGGNTTALQPLSLEPNVQYTITVGAAGAADTNGSLSRFQGTDSNGTAFDILAQGGGKGAGNGAPYGYDNGGSGGGGSWTQLTYYTWARGNGTTGQGFEGGHGYASSTSVGGGTMTFCNAFGPGQWCTPVDYGTGGGGGAGGAGSNGSAYGGAGGRGMDSTITGTNVNRAGGGPGYGLYGGSGWHPLLDQGSEGCGGSGVYGVATDGGIILRYPINYTISNPGGGLTMTSGWTGGYYSSLENCTKITGAGAIEFT